MSEFVDKAEAWDAVIATGEKRNKTIATLTARVAELRNSCHRMKEDLKQAEGLSHTLEAENDDKAARIEELEARLEIDHHYVSDGNKFVRVEIPPGERNRQYDGIECRNETINLQAKRIETLETTLGHWRQEVGKLHSTRDRKDARIAELEEALRPFADEARAWANYPESEFLVEGFPGIEETNITVGHLRNAAATLNGGNGND